MPNFPKVEFWPGMSAEIDGRRLARSAIPVKGVSYHSPLRFLEIYANSASSGIQSETSAFGSSFAVKDIGWENIEKLFFPRIPGTEVVLGDSIPQPPFAWRQADAQYLALSFTYNTNAFFRIFSELCERGRIAPSDVEPLLDKACAVLTGLYRSRSHFLIRNINNNFNMYLISKVVESLVGKRCYDSERQEFPSTRRSLAAALMMAPDHQHLPIVEKMGVALGKGVSFMESRMHKGVLGKGAMTDAKETMYRFYHRSIVIDHRLKLLDMISNVGTKKSSFALAVILDDATETVDDLLWLQDLIQCFPFFKVRLLVNTAQISINFSSQMLKEVWRSPCFRQLVSKLDSQFLVVPIYCPFISFQTSYLPPQAKEAIRAADAVFVKGANFFETCQIPEKDTFHAFVVYGPISRAYSGFCDLDGVFAHIPAGRSGYYHREKSFGGIVNLDSVIKESSGSAASNRKDNRYSNHALEN
jgi:hypothetical protein